MFHKNLYEMTHEERIETRNQNRKLLAEAHVRVEKIAQLRRVIDSINAESDAAAEAHAKATKPLQEKLSKLHDKRILEVMTGEDSSKKDTEERARLLLEIESANQTLSDVAESNKNSVRRVLNEISDLERGEAVCNIESRIATLCCATLNDETFVVKSAVKYADARAKAARAQVAEHEEYIGFANRQGPQYASDRRKYERRLGHWHAEWKEASAELTRKMQRADEVHAAKLADEK